MKKKTNWNPAHNVDLDSWRQNQIHKWTHQIIVEQNSAFRIAHEKDTDEELRDFVRKQAAQLGFMPHPLEIQGGLYIRERLGDWDELALGLGIKPVGRNRARQVYSRLRKQGEERFIQERKAKKMFKAMTKDQQKQVRLAEQQKEDN